MCFIKRIGKNIPKPQIAERDIVVYKYTKSYGSSFCCDNTKFLSLIYNFKYITNKKSKKIPLTPRLSTLFEIYPWLRNSSNYHTNDCPVISINKGYHSYMSLNRVKEDILDDSPIYRSRGLLRAGPQYCYFCEKKHLQPDRNGEAFFSQVRAL